MGKGISKIKVLNLDEINQDNRKLNKFKSEQKFIENTNNLYPIMKSYTKS